MSFIVRTILLDEVAFPEYVPQNDGIFRPVKVIAPKGTIFNPNFPRACFSRFCQVQRVVDHVLHALAPVVPEKVTAGNSAHPLPRLLRLRRGGGRVLALPRGQRGLLRRPSTRDGMDSVDNLIANTRNNPIEELDRRFPMRSEQYELRDEPARPATGAAASGSSAATASSSTRSILARATARADPPRGIFGGHEGLNASLTSQSRAKPDEESWPAKITGKTMRKSGTIEITVPNSGGYGDPLKRVPEQVLSDVLDEFTTLELARQDYGVVINSSTMTVDVGATEALRARLKNKSSPVDRI